MAASTSTPHLERTANEPRDPDLHQVTITRITHPNHNIRILHLFPTHHPTSPNLNTPNSIKFKPGQWVDVHCPDIPKPGGFTITSAPETKEYIELAVQKSPGNPAAVYLWRDEGVVLGTEVGVRVGGGFVWPPPLSGFGFGMSGDGDGVEGDVKRAGEGEGMGLVGIKRVVFIAGGVGVNPLMSMVSSISELKSRRLQKENWGSEGKGLGFKVVFLYSSKDVDEEGGEILFLSRLRDVFTILGDEGDLRVFLTGGKKSDVNAETNPETNKEISMKSRIKSEKANEIEFKRGRVQTQDIIQALGPVEDRGETVCYICGVPGMTDEFIEVVKGVEGMREERVLCERWW